MLQLSYVPDADAATQLTELTAVGDAFDTDDDDRLAAFYAYPDDLDRCWVRANMIASLDGGATDDGKAGGLAGPGDRALFAPDAPGSRRHPRRRVDRAHRELLRRADVASRNARSARRRGQAEVPPIAVVTHGRATSSTTPSCSPAPRCRR